VSGSGALACAAEDWLEFEFRADCWKVAGIDSTRHLLGGQTIQNARPTTSFSGMVPPPGNPS
jgi:hypothetical protein